MSNLINNYETKYILYLKLERDWTSTRINIGKRKTYELINECQNGTPSSTLYLTWIGFFFFFFFSHIYKKMYRIWVSNSQFINSLKNKNSVYIFVFLLLKLNTSFFLECRKLISQLRFYILNLTIYKLSIILFENLEIDRYKF